MAVGLKGEAEFGNARAIHGNSTHQTAGAVVGVNGVLDGALQQSQALVASHAGLVVVLQESRDVPRSRAAGNKVLNLDQSASQRHVVDLRPSLSIIPAENHAAVELVAVLVDEVVSGSGQRLQRGAHNSVVKLSLCVVADDHREHLRVGGRARAEHEHIRQNARNLARDAVDDDRTRRGAAVSRENDAVLAVHRDDGRAHADVMGATAGSGGADRTVLGQRLAEPSDAVVRIQH
ncbi:uncharacterized protein BcabD6B2_27290 [Babesia caballi]|uniref:Uncharacterized protein n=1 Tax=Babesia caballi TaxID=5871 RepID=A0AAV4LTG5_BABCB|nr:hypothetical protein BcabD6B2_27290 [Babesia caballi]